MGDVVKQCAMDLAGQRGHVVDENQGKQGTDSPCRKNLCVSFIEIKGIGRGKGEIGS